MAVRAGPVQTNDEVRRGGATLARGPAAATTCLSHTHPNPLPPFMLQDLMQFPDRINWYEST